MDYEELYASLTAASKEVQDCLRVADESLKKAQHGAGTGNLAELSKALEQLSQAAQQMTARAANVQEEVAAFDTKEYFQSGEFARQMVAACRAKGIDVKGEKGIYEMFPFKVRVIGDADHAQEVNVNRRRLPTFRPSYVATYIAREQARLNKEKFNLSGFMNELAEAYDLVCARDGIRPNNTVRLGKIYKILTPMSRARRDYDVQMFAYDLARLYQAGPEAWVAKDGRHFQFGTSQNATGGVRVLSTTGVETQLMNLRSVITLDHQEA